MLSHSRRVTKAQVEKLEQKVEDLVTLLTSTQGAIPSSANVQPTSKDENRPPVAALQTKQRYDFGKIPAIWRDILLDASNDVWFCFVSGALVMCSPEHASISSGFVIRSSL